MKMELKWNGHSSFSLYFEDGTVLITDPFDAAVGYPVVTERADIVTVSHAHHDHNAIDTLAAVGTVITTPGSVSVKGIRITGMETSHDHHGGAHRGKNIVFVIEGDGLRFAHMGDLGHLPDAETVRAMGKIDVMFLPIGGCYTIDTQEALRVMALVKPHTTIPMHYRTSAISFPIADETEFEKCTQAGRPLLSRVRFSKDTLAALPAAMILEPPLC